MSRIPEPDCEELLALFRDVARREPNDERNTLLQALLVELERRGTVLAPSKQQRYSTTRHEDVPDAKATGRSRSIHTARRCAAESAHTPHSHSVGERSPASERISAVV
jgi:hypothetical protein